MQAREQLEAIYMDWINNYLTTTAYAEHNGLTEEQAKRLIEVARSVFNTEHPDR